MLEEFFDWAGQSGVSTKPWLILGKGPSFSRRSEFDLQEYSVLALNHTVREVQCDISHVIDIEVVQSCATEIEVNAQVLVMPWVPHQGNAIPDKTLEDWVEQIPVLKRLASTNRLKWYNLRTTRVRNGGGAVVQADCFSAEAAVSALGLAGVREIRTAGVDGGTSYDAQFNDLSDVTRLNNGQASYDMQFKGIAKSIFSHSLDFGPLHIQTPIRVFVGSQKEQMLSVKVLEYTLKKHSSISVEVVPLHTVDALFPTPKSPDNKPRTPFSFQRFVIPQAAGYTGRAIYLDSDMMVFKDIAPFWCMDMQGCELLSAGCMEGSVRVPQYSVMLLDCQALDWSPESIVKLLDDGVLTYETLMYEMKLVQKQAPLISEHWNALEYYSKTNTALIHYTDMSRQPWVSRRNPNGRLWVQALIDAVADGFVSLDYIQDHVERGWVRPSLLQQVKSKNPKSSQFSLFGALADKAFIPPYKKM